MAQSVHKKGKTKTKRSPINVSLTQCGERGDLYGTVKLEKRLQRTYYVHLWQLVVADVLNARGLHLFKYVCLISWSPCL